MNPPTRAALRSSYRRARRALPRQAQRDHARAVARHFAATRLLLAFDCFAIYLPSDGELDPGPLARRLLTAGKTVAVPVIGTTRVLSFYRYRDGARWVRNRFDIAEPDTRTETRVPTRTIDVALLPLVAFDDAGVRFGRGGGYYDATFAEHSRTLRIGIAHELQRHEGLERNAWDAPLDGVITERGARGFTIRARRFMNAATR
jgi:5-formyltetrahydrofolate cyclo-ligase